MAPANLKAAAREANAKHRRMEQEKRTRKFIEESSGEEPHETHWVWIVFFILILCLVGYSIVQATNTVWPGASKVFQWTPKTTATPFGLATPTPMIVTPTEAVNPTITPSAMMPTAMPTDANGINPMPLGGVYNPVQIPNELAVPDFNGTLSTSPQRIACAADGKPNVSFDYRPDNGWTKLYVLTTVPRNAVFVKTPSSFGGTVTIYCPSTFTSYFYIYAQ